MAKELKLYQVETMSGRKFFVWAASGEKAKRTYCKENGIKANDFFCGVPSLSARKLTEAEVEEWQQNEPARAATLNFVKGMLEIGAKINADLGTRSLDQ